MSIKPTNIYDFTVPANGVYRLHVAGEYFKILLASGAVNVLADWGRLKGLTSGQGLEDSEFQWLIFEDTTGGDNTLRVVIGDRRFIDGVSGAMTVQQNAAARAAFTNTQRTVTSASQQLIAANTARQYLFVQNRHASGFVYLNFGAAATAGNGIKIGPGGFWESGAVCPTSAIHMIGDVASNTEVLTVEG